MFLSSNPSSQHLSLFSFPYLIFSLVTHSFFLNSTIPPLHATLCSSSTSATHKPSHLFPFTLLPLLNPRFPSLLTSALPSHPALNVLSPYLPQHSLLPPQTSVNLYTAFYFLYKRLSFYCLSFDLSHSRL